MKTVSTYLALFALAGCSVINSFDDVKKAVSASGGRDGGGNTGGSGGSSTVTDGGGGASSGGKGGATGGTAGATGGTAGATGGTAGAGGGGPVDSGADVFVPGGATGALVAYNVTDKKLYVLDPETGAPLSSEAMGTVRAIVNDGATDNWYIFEVTGPLAGGVTVHSRQLNTKSGEWNELGKTAGVPAPVGGRPGVPTNRIAYLSDPTLTNSTSSPPTAWTLTVLDTTDPTKVTVFGTPLRPLPAGSKQGVLAESKSINVVMLSSTCSGEGGVCDAILAHNIVSDTDVTASLTSVIGQVLPLSNIEFATDPSRHNDVIAFPNSTSTKGTCTSPGATGVVQAFTSSTLAASTTPISFDIFSQRFSSSTFDSCTNTIFLTSYLEDQSIWAVPLTAGGTPAKLCVGGGLRLLFDPYTKTLFRTADTGLEAYRSTGTATAPSLQQRSLSKLPTGFSPGAMTVRRPDQLAGCN